ncbi:uncharacterized protein LOC135937600 [Cloeon dipterum]|uniref:uncharacterized protein LOC135937600 n=1 Tax=Cloeon dipterum TaxID=197152 RepID=UPI0032203C59
MEDLVHEYKELQNGFMIENFDEELRLEVGGPVVADMPAKAGCCYVKVGGYYSCDKCTAKGEWNRAGKTVIFKDLTCVLRTDGSFRARKQKDHHHGKSILEELDVDMVADFPIDYMHCTCLGTTKRLLVIYIKESRLSKVAIKEACELYKTTLSSKPTEFRWKTSTLDLDKFEKVQGKTI